MWERTWGGVCMLMHLYPWVEAGGAQLSLGILWSLLEAGMGVGTCGLNHGW